MYPRNAVTPERIAVGAVVLIADGTVQTSGVSITVVPQGGTTAAGGGTTTYEQGVVFYAPTQAETNYTSFIVTAYKSACIPVSVTVVTTASVTPGKVVLSGETHTSAVIPTVTTVGTLTTYTGNTPQTGDTYSLANGATGFNAIDTVVDAINANVGTAGAGLTNINLPNQIMDITGNITGNLSGSVGSVTGNVGGIAGTITTLDGLDTAQDTQHSTTQGAISTAQADITTLKAGIITGSAQTGTLSTSTMTTDLTGYTADQLVGRAVTFTSGAADGESTIITAYAVTGGQVSFAGNFVLTVAPGNADTFKIT